MSVYQLLNNQSTVQSAPGTVQGGPPGSNLPAGSTMATLYGGAGEAVQASNNQGFQLVLTTTAGNGSCTVQPVASNDGVNWFNYGSALTIASGATPSQQTATGAGFWRYISAYVTAISGTGAMVDCLMNA